jgi:hypothetical protein
MADASLATHSITATFAQVVFFLLPAEDNDAMDGLIE